MLQAAGGWPNREPKWLAGRVRGAGPGCAPRRGARDGPNFLKEIFGRSTEIVVLCQARQQLAAQRGDDDVNGGDIHTRLDQGVRHGGEGTRKPIRSGPELIGKGRDQPVIPPRDHPECTLARAQQFGAYRLPSADELRLEASRRRGAGAPAHGGSRAFEAAAGSSKDAFRGQYDLGIRLGLPAEAGVQDPNRGRTQLTTRLADGAEGR